MKFGFLIILAVLSVTAPRSAHAWWNHDWEFRKKITLDLSVAGAPAGSDLVQVPILIRLHAGNFDFIDAEESGADLRVIASDDKTPLSFHIERYDWINELGYIWVQLPKLAAGTPPPFIWLYYGNANAAASGDAKSVWDANQTLVYHFADKEPLPQDATSFANNASRSTATASPVGQIDVGAHYDGNAVTTVPASPSLKLPAKGAFTFSAWIKTEGSQSATLFQQQDGKRSLTIALDNNQPVIRFIGDDGSAIATPVKGRVVPDEWHLLAATASDKLVVYLDGVEVAETMATLPEIGGDITIGGTQTPGSGFKGLIDEVRLANVARSTDWLKFETIAESPDSKLLSYGEDEQASSGSDYLATISLLAGAVSLDGWIVIGLIGLLGFVSGEVAIAKTMMLRRTARANKRFLEGFRGKGVDVLTLGEGDATAGGAWKDSSLFALYAAGAEEFRRLREAQGDRQSFSTLNLEVVRAAVDTSLVGEANRINDKMVLLTLAVSGAPFLGLLGTVVGIMITFATIALKGDVNINTIAPGIAAAITATAAGMLVAIPALFAYNVLATRIREITTVMETFRDEFLSKIAARFA